ncbi:MAG: hypothetical protein SF182_23800 [Deltaproteobacteria bacterium]|nr:hypothetical protein [Deltaproteobacteria bacterium]
MPGAGLPPRRTAVDWLLLSAALVASLIVWRALPSSYFQGDDFMNLFRIVDRPLGEYLLSTHAGHVLVVRNAVFYLFARLFGTDAARYFVVVLLTHLLNTALLFGLLRRVTRSPWVAGFGALLFGTCPVAEGALAWYSVYGQVLVPTALLLSLTLASRAAARGRALARGEALLAGAAMIAAALSFGIGIAVAMLLPVALALVVPRPPGRAAWRLPLLALPLLVPLCYLAAYAAYDRVAGTATAEGPRALASVALQHWWRVPEMVLGLLGYGGARLLGGAVPLPFGAPWVMVAGLLALLGLSAAAYRRGDGATRRWLLAAWLLTLGAYGIIALGRIYLWNENAFFMAAQARYHYTTLATLSLIVCLGLSGIAPRPLSRAGAAGGLFGLWLVAAAGAFAAWPPAPYLNTRERREVDFALNWMRARVAAAPPQQPVYLTNRALHAAGALFIGMNDFPGWAALFAVYYPTNEADGHRVYFVEREAQVRERYRDGRRTRDLLVAPEAAPPEGSPTAAPEAHP